ncbi:MAG: aminotransferase class V-fold PLP-dependent enzyme [Ktedonobacteraceae bacterium]
MSSVTNLSYIQRIRQEMPAATSRIYLNNGTFGPMPTHVVQAMQERLQYELQNGRLGTEAFEKMKGVYVEARTRVAHLLNADVQEIALTDSTGDGMNIVSYGLNWREGDEVITTNHEHISALAPLYQLRDRYGIVIRIADLGPRADRPALEVIEPLVTARTRMIVVSHVTWTTGVVLDVAAITRFGHEHGIPVLIDGAQSAGDIPIDVKALGVDFYAIPMQKWLCGPDGTGALYVNRESQHYITPTYVGYWSVKHEPGIEWEFEDFAQRFELGGRQTAALAGQATVLKWMAESVGYEWLFERIKTLSTYTYNALKQIPTIKLLTPQAGTSGLISFTLGEIDVAEVVQKLHDEHNIYIRNIPSNNSLRVSTGFYNTEEEIDTLVEALTKM